MSTAENPRVRFRTSAFSPYGTNLAWGFPGFLPSGLYYREADRDRYSRAIAGANEMRRKAYSRTGRFWAF